MLASFGNVYAYLLGWPVLSKVHKALFYLSARALGLHNFRSDAISGEIHAVRLGLHGKSAPVIFDVGANEGSWLATVLAQRPSAVIHAFEPQTRLADQIRQRHPAVTVNAMALGETPGSLDLHDYVEHEGSQHASLLAGVIDGLHHGRARSVSVPIDTIDGYCERHAVAHIDLLKVDVEGFELQVLRGSRRMLEAGAVDVIQFEFNEMNVVAHAFMNDFFGILGTRFDLHRLLPHGLLPIRPGAHWINEQFVFQNLVAVRKAHPLHR